MVYLLEDDQSIRELVCYTLNKTGVPAIGFDCPSAFWEALKGELPQLLLLDVMLPEEDGIAVLTRLRAEERTADLPVIILTAKSAEFDKVDALDRGADDYITKPFGVMELVARVKAVLRRAGRVREEDSAEEKDLCLGQICVSPAKHTVTVSGEPVVLTYKEFRLLCLLLENRGTVLTRDRILDTIWGYSFDGENRTVDVHIRTLRQKLGAAGDCVETVRGVGYKIAL